VLAEARAELERNHEQRRARFEKEWADRIEREMGLVTRQIQERRDIERRMDWKEMEPGKGYDRFEHKLRDRLNPKRISDRYDERQRREAERDVRDTTRRATGWSACSTRSTRGWRRRTGATRTAPSRRNPRRSSRPTGEVASTDERSFPAGGAGPQAATARRPGEHHPMLQLALGSGGAGANEIAVYPGQMPPSDAAFIVGSYYVPGVGMVEVWARRPAVFPWEQPPET